MLDNLILIFQSHDWLWLSSVFVFSLLVGSFLNVVIYRLPIMLERSWRLECQEMLADELKGKKLTAPEPAVFNLIVPHSTCPQCKTAIRPWHNIPVISWLALRGKCSNCHNPISARYPIIELSTAILATAIAHQMGWGLPGFALIFFALVMV